MCRKAEGVTRRFLASQFSSNLYGSKGLAVILDPVLHPHSVSSACVPGRSLRKSCRQAGTVCLYPGAEGSGWSYRRSTLIIVNTQRIFKKKINCISEGLLGGERRLSDGGPDR